MTRRLPLSTDGLASLDSFPDVRLVAIDIDGTLLDEASAEVAEVIGGLSRSLAHYSRGVTVTIATGRAFRGAQGAIRRLQLPHKTPVILYNGAVVCHADGTALTRVRTLRADAIRTLVAIALQAKLSPLVYEPDAPIFASSESEERSGLAIVERVTGFSTESGMMSREFNELRVEWRSDTDRMPEAASAIVIPTPVRISRQVLAALSAVAGASVTSSSTAYLEIRPEGANKGSALSLIAGRESLTPNQVLAIGDNDNDVEMLRWAGSSVAVANSTPLALDASDFVTEGKAGEGVVETLRLLYDARRHRLHR